MKGRLTGLLLTGALVLALGGCGGGESTPTSAPSPSTMPSPSGGSVTTPAPTAEPTPTGGTQPSRPLSLTVDGETVEAGWFEGDGYRLLLPMTGVELHEWDGGETFVVENAGGSYLSVSVTGLGSVQEAAEGLRFEYGVEDEGSDFPFGRGDYAGLRLTQEGAELTQEYVLYQFEGRVFLVESAVFAGTGDAGRPLLEAMRDSVEFLK